MCRRFVLVLAVATLGSASVAQSASTSAQPTTPPPALPASPRSNVLSVVVQDREGHSVRGLKPQNFRVTEGGVPQAIARMEEHSSQSPTSTAPAFPSLPPGTFTNYTPIAPGETLNILLIDALNTPLKDRALSARSCCSMLATPIRTRASRFSVWRTVSSFCKVSPRVPSRCATWWSVN